MSAPALGLDLGDCQRIATVGILELEGLGVQAPALVGVGLAVQASASGNTA